MAIQISTAVNNACLDVIETVIGASAKLRIYSGSQPTNCAAVASGSLLVDITLPLDWMSTAINNYKAKLGTWTAPAYAAGTAGHFRITDSTGNTVGMQGSVGLGNGDLSLDDVTFDVGQVVTVDSFTTLAPYS